MPVLKGLEIEYAARSFDESVFRNHLDSQRFHEPQLQLSEDGRTMHCEIELREAEAAVSLSDVWHRADSIASVLMPEQVPLCVAPSFRDEEGAALKGAGAFDPEAGVCTWEPGVNPGPYTTNDAGHEVDACLKRLRLRSARDRFGVDGSGVTIIHLDTGYAENACFDRAVNEGRLHLLEKHNLIDPVAQGLPIDPLTPSGLVPCPGHGASTLSVLVGGCEPVDGVAPGATVIPWRIAPSVMLNMPGWRSAVARAIRRSLREHPGPLIMNLSMGWIRMGRQLAAALREAEAQGVLFFAAAGQVGPTVPAFFPYVGRPAHHPSTFGMAGCTWDGRVLEWSGHGKGVDLTIPVEWLPRADVLCPREDAFWSYGRGTSYASAVGAGAAALWIQRWQQDRHDPVSRAIFEEAVRQRLLPQLFRSTLARAGFSVPYRTGGNDRAWGQGVLDIERLLACPLEAPDLPKFWKRVATRLKPEQSAERELMHAGADVLGGLQRDQKRHLRRIIHEALADLPAEKGPFWERSELLVERYGDKVLVALDEDAELRELLDRAGVGALGEPEAEGATLPAVKPSFDRNIERRAARHLREMMRRHEGS